MKIFHLIVKVSPPLILRIWLLKFYKGSIVIPYDTFNELSHDPFINPVTHSNRPNLLPTCKEHINVILD